MTEVPKTIRVTGTGFAKQAPDQIEVQMTFETVDADYTKMFNLAAEKIEKLQTALTKRDFQPDVLKTKSFTVDTKYESYHDQQGNWQQRFVGYQLTQGAELVLPLDMARLGQIVTAIDEAKGQPTLKLAFTLVDPTTFQRELLAQATKDARSKAEVLALASGSRLGELIQIDYSWDTLRFASETSVSPSLRQADLLMSEVALPEINPMDIEGQDTVTFVWLLG